MKYYFWDQMIEWNALNNFEEDMYPNLVTIDQCIDVL